MWESVKSLPCSPPFPHPYCLLWWNGWLWNQIGWEGIVLNKSMFTDPGYLPCLLMLIDSGRSCLNLPTDWTRGSWFHFLIFKTYKGLAFFLPQLPVILHYNSCLSLMMDTCFTITTILTESYPMEWKAFSCKCSWTYCSSYCLVAFCFLNCADRQRVLESSFIFQNWSTSISANSMSPTNGMDAHPIHQKAFSLNFL